MAKSIYPRKDKNIAWTCIAKTIEDHPSLTPAQRAPISLEKLKKTNNHKFLNGEEVTEEWLARQELYGFADSAVTYKDILEGRFGIPGSGRKDFEERKERPRTSKAPDDQVSDPYSFVDEIMSHPALRSKTKLKLKEFYLKQLK